MMMMMIIIIMIMMVVLVVVVVTVTMGYRTLLIYFIKFNLFLESVDCNCYGPNR
jgi:hypothetical protein